MPNCSLHDFRLRVGADVRWAQMAVRGEKEVRFFGERRDLELRTNNLINSTSDLLAISGIGPATVNGIRDHVT